MVQTIHRTRRRDRLIDWWPVRAVTLLAAVMVVAQSILVLSR